MATQSDRRPAVARICPQSVPTFYGSPGAASASHDQSSAHDMHILKGPRAIHKKSTSRARVHRQDGRLQDRLNYAGPRYQRPEPAFRTSHAL
jgi:hypothetical protein